MRTYKALALFALGFAGALASTAGAPRAQQHGYTQQQIDEGRQLYQSNCGRCHNDDGAGVAGVELFKQIRRATSDEDVARLVQTGIPGSSMPPHSFTNPQALNVVAYLRTMVGAAAAPRPTTTGPSTIGALTGEAARGQAVFSGKGACTTCHAVNGAGATTAPDLAAVLRPPAGGARRGGFAAPPVTAATLERSLIEPDADVAVPYRVFQVVTSQGQTVRGTLLNQDTFSTQMRDQAGELRAFMKSDLASFSFQPSPMPSYRGRLTNQEIADVVAYLLTLRTPVTP